MWGALTTQGKLAVVAAVVLLFVLFAIAYGGGNEGPRTPRPPATGQPPGMVGQAVASPPQQQTAAPGATQAAAASPQTAGSPQPSPPASPTLPVATATPEPPMQPVPTATPAPTRPPPTATAVPPSPTPEPPPPPSGCQVEATLTLGGGSADSVRARLVCNGVPVAGAPMTAVFYYQGATGNCVAPADSAGFASCSSRLSGNTGALNSVSACFGHMGQLYCGETRP